MRKHDARRRRRRLVLFAGIYLDRFLVMKAGNGRQASPEKSLDFEFQLNDSCRRHKATDVILSRTFLAPASLRFDTGRKKNSFRPEILPEDLCR